MDLSFYDIRTSALNSLTGIYRQCREATRQGRKPTIAKG